MEHVLSRHTHNLLVGSIIITHHHNNFSFLGEGENSSQQKIFSFWGEGENPRALFFGAVASKKQQTSFKISFISAVFLIQFSSARKHHLVQHFVHFGFIFRSICSSFGARGRKRFRSSSHHLPIFLSRRFCQFFIFVKISLIFTFPHARPGQF